MQATVQWVENLNFLATSGSGHQVSFDGDKGKHAPSPMEMVLMAMASCSSVDVVSILEKARQRVTDVRCHVKGQRADAVPAVFTDIHLEFVITGYEVAAHHVERAVQLSAEKYCSVAKMLEASVNISHSFRIENA